MLYLMTGSNGVGKTLFTLKWVREMQLLWKKKHKIDRPVYYDGFEIVPEYEEKFGWKPCDPSKWYELPDNSIIMVDECQRIYPARSQGAVVPDHEQRIATEHRKRGFDFYLVCQHPNQINTFIRHLIGSGWHRHLKRIFGMNRVNCLEYNYAETSCEKPAGKAGAYRSMKLRYPKEVYKWYKSAVMHTAKVNVPPVVYWTIGAALVAVMAVWNFYSFMTRNQNKEPEKAQAATVQMATASTPGHPGYGQPEGVMSTAHYVDTFKPRVNQMLHTASRYDEITKPVTAPYPAACIYSEIRDTCKCYTQQGTPYALQKPACIKIARSGYFLDWEPNPDQRQEAQS